jgi:hypothetical protein
MTDPGSSTIVVALEQSSDTRYVLPKKCIKMSNIEIYDNKNIEYFSLNFMAEKIFSHVFSKYWLSFLFDLISDLNEFSTKILSITIYQKAVPYRFQRIETFGGWVTLGLACFPHPKKIFEEWIGHLANTRPTFVGPENKNLEFKVIPRPYLDQKEAGWQYFWRSWTFPWLIVSWGHGLFNGKVTIQKKRKMLLNRFSEGSHVLGQTCAFNGQFQTRTMNGFLREGKELKLNFSQDFWLKFGWKHKKNFKITFWI